MRIRKRYSANDLLPVQVRPLVMLGRKRQGRDAGYHWESHLKRGALNVASRPSMSHVSLTKSLRNGCGRYANSKS